MITVSDPAFPDDYYVTAAELEADMNGTKIGERRSADHHWLCDWCSKGVSFNAEPRCAGYMADWTADSVTTEAKWIAKTGRLANLAGYCPECSTPKLLFPREGTTEVRYMADIDTDGHLRNVEVTDISPADDGIPWEPNEVMQLITGAPIDVIIGDERGEAMGPENIVTVLLAVNPDIDIRELVNWDGSIDRKVLGRARKMFRKHGEEMAETGFDRTHFRDHARGEK